MYLCCYLLSWENRGYTRCCLLLSVGTSEIGNWKSEIVNQTGLLTNSSEIDVITQKWVLFRKTKVSFKGVFSSKSKSCKKNERLQDKGTKLIQNSAIKCYHEFHVRLRKDIEMLILAAHFLLLTKVTIVIVTLTIVIVTLYKIKGAILRWKKFMKGKTSYCFWCNFLSVFSVS